MVAERRRPLAPEEAREADLAARGRQQILAADHEVDALAVVVDGGGELVGPVAEPIANQDVTALLGRILFLRAENLGPQEQDPAQQCGDGLIRERPRHLTYSSPDPE